MAINIKTKPKVQKPTRAAMKSIDSKYYGGEPMYLGQATEHELTTAFNWYNYMFDHTQAKKWLLEYMKLNKYDPKLIAAIRSAPDWRTPTTAGWVARMIMNGTVFNDRYMARLEERIQTNAILTVKEEKKEVVDFKPAITIQDRVKKANGLVLADAEAEVIDSRKDMYSFLQARQVTPAAAKRMLEYYQPVYDEVMSDDIQVKEAFGKKLKAERLYMQSIVDDLNRYIGNKKVTKIRKPREKKVKTAVDQIKSLKFQKEFPALKIVSINPADIIGANQLWTYNTKYKKLTRYDASGPAGIQVKGTTLIGYDVEKSLTKSLRKPDISIQQLLGAGRVALRNFMAELKTTETKPNGRINEDTILLRKL